MNKTKEMTPVKRILFFVLLFTVPPLALFLILNHDIGLSEQLDRFCTWCSGAFTLLALCATLNYGLYMGNVFAMEKEVQNKQQNEETLMYIFEGEVPDNVKDIAIFVPLSN